ncbi:hypothetical protein ACFPVV_07180 [Macrococcoides bohemicum]|nr:hypothetical protein [Macrococcus bohemicus]
MNKISVSDFMMWVAVVLLIIYVLYVNLDTDSKAVNFVDEYPLISQN